MGGDPIIDSPAFRKVKALLENIDEYNIRFTKHFRYKSSKRRGISTDIILNYLNSPEKLRRVDPSRGKYKAWFKESNKYSVVIILIRERKDISIITSYKTNRQWQKGATITGK